MADHERLLAALDRRVTRRDLLRWAGRGSLSLGAMAFLAACGVQGQRRRGPRLEPLPPKAGELQMANWPLYIDKAKGRPVTAQTFEERFDVDMTYEEVIDDNEAFFGTIREPLAQGEPTGWDLIVVTDWLVAKMVRLGYLEQLHHEELPTATANLADRFRDPGYDPGNRHSFPWAAGITGIGYDVSLTGRELTRVDDLFDPEWAGRVGLFTEMRDTFGLLLLSQDVVPEEATVDDVQRAQQKLLDNRDKIRGFYGNEYADQLATGSLAVSMAWSGDVFALQQDNPNLRFAVPDEGAMRWTDNMVIPAGAEHPTDAHLFMDFVYDPRIAANITEWVWYESPVEGVQAVIQEDAQEDRSLRALARSELVFPSPEVEENLYRYKSLDEEEEQAWNELFQEVTQG